MKALIKVGYGCNDHCSFCHTLDVRHIDAEAAEVHAKIERAKALGHEMVVLSGGEPTIRPELLRWAEHTERLGMRFGLVTNGRMLAYPELVEQLMERGLGYVYLSLHGGTAKVHNLMVRSQAFEETYGALRNLSGRGLDLTVNCVITKHNLGALLGMVDAVAPYPDALLKFSMVEPKGGGEKLFEHLMPRVSEVAEAVKAAFRYAEKKTEEGAPALRLAHGAIPLCLMEGYEDRYDDLKSHRFWTMIEVGEPDFYPVDDLNKVQPEEPCRGCALRGPCPGLYKGYRESFGAEEILSKKIRPRSNSFDYIFEGMLSPLGGSSEEGCPLLSGAGVTPWDRGRHLLIRRGPKVARYRAESRDFSDAEIEEIKHALGQVYVDVSKKAAPDDFARDLCKLERSSLCEGCPERERCTGLFEPRFEDLFGRDDAEVEAHLMALRGAVLDLGCGHGPYDAALGERAEARAITYLGLDPDREAIEARRARLDWGELKVGEAESLPEGWTARFDHALMLRSWNHLRDPGKALAELRRALRPGGSLLVVDNVAFGLARSPAQSARAKRATAARPGAGFEHYRNDRAVDAERALVEAGFLIEEVAEVRPERSNQWWIRARAPQAEEPS